LNQFVNDIKYDFDSILISFSSNSMYASVIIENLTHIILNQFVNDVKSNSYDFNVLYRKIILLKIVVQITNKMVLSKNKQIKWLYPFFDPTNFKLLTFCLIKQWYIIILTKFSRMQF